ncbi:MAG: hypothetical protein GXP15_12365 [Gammaproteobacteria bacterium]|nr:hypothetical protein [Gammaproteobacteria bacterium]
MMISSQSRSSKFAKIKTLCLAIVTVIALSACGTVSTIVPDAEGAKRISAIGLGCNKPYKFTQDCSGFSGATRRIELSNVQFKIAGTEDGAIVLMMGAKQMSDAVSGKSSETANIAYEVTKKFLLGEGVQISLVEPVASGSLLAGYIITTDSNTYSLLSKHTIEK